MLYLICYMLLKVWEGRSFKSNVPDAPFLNKWANGQMITSYQAFPASLLHPAGLDKAGTRSLALWMSWEHLCAQLHGLRTGWKGQQGVFLKVVNSCEVLAVTEQSGHFQELMVSIASKRHFLCIYILPLLRQKVRISMIPRGLSWIKEEKK